MLHMLTHSVVHKRKHPHHTLLLPFSLTTTLSTEKKKTPSPLHYKPMTKGKPCQPDMSLREKQQMTLVTEQSTHTGTTVQPLGQRQSRMEGQSRSSYKYLLLQVWCGLLTVGMVVMAALLTSTKPMPTEDVLKPHNPTASPTVNIAGSLAARSEGSSLSYIQLIKSVQNNSWEETHIPCESCSLILQKNAIHCKKKSLYFIYAQVTFPKHSKKNRNKYVILKKDHAFGRSLRILVEGTFPNTTEGTVWVAKIVSLEAGDSVRLDITDDDFLIDSTFWGAYELH